MTKRKSISKRRRFALFARDNFTCQYCGRQSDQVKLVLDHVIPVTKEGSGEDENLITSCEECNQGKADKLIEQFAPNETSRLCRMQEMQEQVAAAKMALAAAKARKKLHDLVVDYLCKRTGRAQFDESTCKVIVGYAREHGVKEVLEWIDIALERLPSYANDRTIGRYISGIRRRQMEQSATPTPA